MQKAVQDWKTALIDLGGRNNLLHYRDLKLGTLDLTVADGDAVGRLLTRRAVRLSSLFREAGQRDQALRRVRAIHKKAKEYSEERGLATASIGYGLATWKNKRAEWVPCAPVLLQGASLRPIGAALDDFELSLASEMTLNPTLLQALKVDFQCEPDQGKLMERIPDGSIDEPWEIQETYQWISEEASQVPDFRVDERTVLANFVYAKQEMVRDLEGALSELIAHDLIAAMAGDKEARAAIRNKGAGSDSDTVPGPDQIRLADEFLVLDADSSQNYAINAVLAGRDLIIKGPPGTGKSQTISNLIATLVAHGKKVLFVAEKQAAIDAVTRRLGQAGLGDVVLDVHGGVSSRRAFAESIGQALAAISTTPRVDNATELARVEKRRDQLNSYVRAMHEPRAPWDLSVYDMSIELLGLDDARTRVRLPASCLMALDRGAFSVAQEDLERYVALGGLGLALSGSPWADSPVSSTGEAREAADALSSLLGSDLPGTWERVKWACKATGIPLPKTLVAAGRLIRLWMDSAALASRFDPEIYRLDLTAERAALDPARRGGFARLWAALTSSAYRESRARVGRIALAGRKVSDTELASGVAAALKISDLWAELGGEDTPRSPQDVADCGAHYARLRDLLAKLEALSGCSGLAELPVADCQQALRQLDDDRATLAKLPELHRLYTSLDQSGFGSLVEELAARQASPELAGRCLRSAFLRAVLDYVSVVDVQVSSFSGKEHQRIVAEFATGDQRHKEQTPGRIRRAYAERVVQALDDFPDQAALVRHQAKLKRRHKPVREYTRDASDVLLALKPCWAMSPLVVSQLLPAKPYFDVVIFDEASQITPADATTSILRGRQLVVTGDDRQLPPTAFFASTMPEDDADSDEDDPPLLAGTADFESILDALGSLLGFRMLSWHYRSQDERLIAFSNHHIYDRMLTTFPAASNARVLRFVPVAWNPGESTNSPTSEVNAVVDLILEHAREHPDESLGVITMGLKHSDRIEEAFRQRLRDDPQLAESLGEFLQEGREEYFFIKNIERVQGDERDAIILSVGYGKDAAGRLVYRFGPLNNEGGERRLNVAVTRAKSRLTLASSFSHHDMAPERSSAKGVQLLRQYIQYVGTGGTNLGDHVHERPALNPFEADVRDTLTKLGLSLTPQYGVSGYWIDFAVRHPDQPGRYVLAIECDGKTYHSSKSARDRDRLRQEQLERHGWRFHRIWSSDWFRDKEASAAAALAAYQQALRDIGPATGTAAAKPAGGWPSTPTRERAPFPKQVSSPQRNAGLDPRLASGLSVNDYSDRELERLVRWIKSDEVLRTEEELLTVMMSELGFTRRGSQIVARLNSAIARARQ